MRDNKLVDLSTEFAVDVIKLCDSLQSKGRATAVISQLLKSGTSIGANIREANYAASRADFVNKFRISLKECYETEYWLDIFEKSGIITNAEFSPLNEKCCKIRKLLSASIVTAEANK